MAISRAQLLKELMPGLNALFGLEYKRYQEEHKEIFAIENSERSFEEEVKITGFGPAPVKPEGEAKPAAETKTEAKPSAEAKPAAETKPAARAPAKSAAKTAKPAAKAGAKTATKTATKSVKKPGA